MGNEERPSGMLSSPTPNAAQPRISPTKKPRARVDVTLKKERCPQHPDVSVKKVKMIKNKEVTCWRCSEENNVSLRGKVQDAEALLKKEKEQCASYFNEKCILEKERHEMEEKVHKLEGDLVEKEKTVKKLEEEVSQERAAHEERVRELEEEAHRERGVLEEQRAAVEEEKKGLEEEVKGLNEEVEQLKAKLEEATKRIIAVPDTPPRTPKSARGTPPTTPSRYKLSTPKSLKNIMRPKSAGLASPEPAAKSTAKSPWKKWNKNKKKVDEVQVVTNGTVQTVDV